MAVAGTVADVLGPKLVTERPLLQMFLNPRNRYLLLASPQVDVVPFLVVGFVRLLLTDPLGYVLGRQYGDGALRWAGDKRGDGGRFVRRVERWFGKAAPVVILLAPNLYMCILAGASGMRVRVFAALNAAGTLGRLLVFRVAGEAFRDELLTVVDWIGRNQKWLIAASFVVVSIQMSRARQRGALETPAEIEREIEEAEGHADAEPVDEERRHP